jgi:hypothetical protein
MCKSAMTNQMIIRENQLRLKREMDGLRDDLFAREEEEAIIVDDAHTSSRTEKRAKPIAKLNEPGTQERSI